MTLSTPPHNHLMMTTLPAMVFAEAKSALQRNWTEFCSLPIEYTSYEDTTAILLRHLPWPYGDDEAKDDLRIVNWPILQMDQGFQNLLFALQQVVNKPVARVYLVEFGEGIHRQNSWPVGDYDRLIERLHYVVQTNDQVFSESGGAIAHMEVNTLWWVNNENQHTITNKGDRDAVHLVFEVWK